MNKRNFMQKLWSMCYLSAGGYAVYGGLSFCNNNEKFYNNTLIPLNQQISPELSHRIAVFLAAYKIFPKSKYEDPAVLKTKLMSTELSNPIGIAAGFDKHGEAIEGLHNIGFGFVEIGSVTPKSQVGNSKPRVFRLPEDKAIINRYGFNSDGYDKVFERISSQNLDNIVIGVNLGKNKESTDFISDYVSGLNKFGCLVNYIVINVSSPNTPGLRDLQQKENLETLLTSLINAKNTLGCERKPYLLLKLAPDLSPENKKEIASIVNKRNCKIDGLIISNTTIKRDDLVNKEFSSEIGGLSGQPLKKMSTDMIREMYQLTKGNVPIIGVGGVFSGQDAFEKILAGASVIQIYTSFTYGGPPIITKIKSELSTLLINNGFQNVNEAVGKENLISLKK